MLATIAAVIVAAETAAVSAPGGCGDISGQWCSGWASDYTGGGTPPPVTKTVTVRRAVTPFGTPHAQYVVDYEAALALHPDMAACLGNGTCSAGQFGKARALNSTSPGCTFIQWPAADRQTGGSWCKVPYCPSVPPTPPVYPPFNLTWTPTYQMNRSTIVNPTGSQVGLDAGATLQMDAKYGIVAFDGGTMSCLNQRRFPTTGQCNSDDDCDKCKYAKTISTAEEQARRVKAVNPETHVWTYRNMQLGLSRNEHDCPKMFQPKWAGFWLRNRSGFPIVSTTLSQGACDSVAPAGDYGAEGMLQYYLDWRNASAREWWLDVKLGSLINSTLLDGFYWDDPTFGNEQESVRDNFTPAELEEIDFWMQKTRLEGYMRLSAGGKFCTGSTCFTASPLPMKCVGVRSSANLTCDTSPGTVTANLHQAQANSKRPGFMQIFPYPDRAKIWETTCRGPAAVQPAHVSTPEHWVPGVLQLSCLPGTGTMTVEFASFGRPKIGPGAGGDPTAPTADCAEFEASSTGCDAGPAVLARMKALCDGKQSCRVYTTDPVFTTLPPSTSPGCSSVDAKNPLLLAVRATGCAQGTGGGGNVWFRESLAGFLLTRGDHSWFGFGWIYRNPLVWYPEWDVDYGVPLGPMTIDGNIASRKWTKISVALDLNTFEATFHTE